MPHGACAWCSYTARGGRAWSPVGMYIMLLTARKSWPALGSPTRVHLSAPGHPRVRRPAAFLFVPPPPLPVGLRSARQPCVAWTRWPHERVGVVGARRALDQHTHLMSVPRPAAAGDALQPADCVSRACHGVPSECGEPDFFGRGLWRRALTSRRRDMPGARAPRIRHLRGAWARGQHRRPSERRLRDAPRAGRVQPVPRTPWGRRCAHATARHQRDVSCLPWKAIRP